MAALTITMACQSTRVTPIDTKHGSLALAPDEQKLWNEAQRVERRIEEVGLVYSNAELEAYIHTVTVQLLGDRLERPDSELKVRVLRIPYRNAFAYPNGVLYITTGMLACLDSEAELASVLGHETTHYLRRHALKETRSAENKKLWVDIAGNTTMLVGLGPIVNEIGSAWATAAILGYSRDLEYEADDQGLEELVRAGYDPSVSIHVFEYLREEDEHEDAQTRVRRSTHPQAQERLEHYRELLATRYAGTSQQHGITHREQYLTQIRQLLLDNAVLDQTKARLDFAQQAVEKYVLLWPECPRGYFARGELYRRRHDREALAQAETDYQKAVRLDPIYAEPHRELGLLYRAAGRSKEACDEFGIYVVLAPHAVDSRIIQRYVAELDAELTELSEP